MAMLTVQRPNCWLGPQSSYRPEWGLQNPFASGKQLFCLSHFREALLLNEVMQLSSTQYEAFLAVDKNLTVTGGGVFQLAGCFALCERPYCGGQSFPCGEWTKSKVSLWTNVWNVIPTAIRKSSLFCATLSLRPYLSLCNGCQSRVYEYQ